MAGSVLAPATRDAAVAVFGVVGAITAVAAAIWGAVPWFSVLPLGLAALAASTLAIRSFTSRASLQQALTVPGTVQLAPGARVRESRLSGLSLNALGVAFAGGWLVGTWTWGLSAQVAGFLFLVPALAAVAYTLGRPLKTLQFTVAGLVIETPGSSYTVAWENLASTMVAQRQGQTYLLLEVRDTAALLTTATGNKQRIAAQIGWSRGLYGASVVLVPRAFGVDAGWLGRAVEELRISPERRAELAPPPQISR